MIEKEIDGEVIRDFSEIPYGYCHCGCGKKTKIAIRNHQKLGHMKGVPVMFLRGHNYRGYFGKDAPGWKGGRHVRRYKNTSYVRIFIPEHPRSDCNGYMNEHTLIVERALGVSIGREAVIHHIDGNGENNKLSNLMVFKNSAEHLRFHRMQNKLNKGD